MRTAGKVELFDDATAGTAAITLIEIASTLARRMVRFTIFVIVVPVKPSPCSLLMNRFENLKPIVGFADSRTGCRLCLLQTCCDSVAVRRRDNARVIAHRICFSDHLSGGFSFERDACVCSANVVGCLIHRGEIQLEHRYPGDSCGCGGHAWTTPAREAFDADRKTEVPPRRNAKKH